MALVYRQLCKHGRSDTALFALLFVLPFFAIVPLSIPAAVSTLPRYQGIGKEFLALGNKVINFFGRFFGRF